MRRKERTTIPATRPARALVRAQRHVGIPTVAMLLSLGLSACDSSPREWPNDAARTARKVGAFLHVIDDPVPLAGAPEAVHPMPSVSAAPSGSAPR